ncbi:sensor histidine kinase [Actinoplanes regularis]|uniref:histidine kinase n=1 Tax=Actinoplanes regularis TaxID=52697 RepID=A0A239JZB8_9ACTN|nr:HAMP domain-containing sensor histidine kinase [Actinoplanes regularis]GIE92380.1 two-component sensor histidine kinase [Actinoplanes regularis]SNT10773.1 Signal transduction histidine kinase [Actinoplanes regularis]
MPLRLRLPRRTVRLRLAVLFGLLFFGIGAALLITTYFLVRYSIMHFGSGPQDGAQMAPAGQAAPSPLLPEGGGNMGPQQSSMEFSMPATEAALASQRVVVLQTLWVNSAIALAIMSAASVVLGWLMAGRVLRPLRTITAATRRISATSLNERLSLQGPDDELKELGDTFDGLLSRLQVSFEAQRRFVANASHELRTPLARQRALGQVALADPNASEASLRIAHERILAAGAQQERLIEALLTLARGQAGIEVREPFDLGELTREAVTSRQAEAEHRLIALRADITPALMAGHRNLTERLITNLIDNAIRHNTPHGWLEVRVTTLGARPVLTVRNTGPVVPPEAIDRLLQPFQRLQTERTTNTNGLGLGLSIVQAIVQAQDGTVHIAPLPGGGLAVTVTFPEPPVHLPRGPVTVATRGR